MQKPTTPTRPVQSARPSSQCRAASRSRNVRPWCSSVSRKIERRHRARLPQWNRSGATARNPSPASQSAWRRRSGVMPMASLTTSTPGHGPGPDGAASQAGSAPSGVVMLTCVIAPPPPATLGARRGPHHGNRTYAGCPPPSADRARGIMRGVTGTNAQTAATGDAAGVLATIGNTPLVTLRRVVPPGCGEVVVKVEGQNPTGSMKDRMAQAMVAGAERDGRLRPGGTVVEYTGGSTGASLALVCAARGYRLRIVTSDAFSREKLDHMAALGAELTLVPSEGGLTTKKLILDMIEAARRLSREPHTYWTDQLNNQDSIAGYHPLGEEIWSQTKGAVHAFVHS